MILLLKAQQNLLTKLVNIPNMVVIDYKFVQDVGLVFSLESKNKTQNCPQCGHKVNSLHQNHYRLIKDLPMINHNVYLKINHRQLKCHKCGKVFMERLNFIDQHKPYTERLALRVYKERSNSNLTEVAKRNNLSREEVKHILANTKNKEV